MKMYAHWLDGEYRKALTGVTVQSPTSSEDTEAHRLIKTLALFGGSFVLSDVQIVDSPVLWETFAQNDFRRFLRANSDFLELKAAPVTHGKDSRWAIATSGLERALKVGRIASPMQESGSVIQMCREVVTAGPSADFDELLVRKRGSPDLDALRGFMEAVKYFSSPSAQVKELADGPRHNLYSILELAVSNPDLGGVDRQHVEGTLKLIDQIVENPQGRTRRSVIYEHLDLANRRHLASWKTIVQAWNVAAQKSVCETGGSIGKMANVVPIGAYVDQTADIMLTGTDNDLSPGKQCLNELIPEIPLSFDPGDLSWADLARITNDTKCAEARSTLRAALMTGDQENIASAVRSYADLIAPLIEGRLQSPVGWWIWALGPVLLRFGGPVAPMLGVALFAGQVGERAMVWVVNRLRDRVIAARVVESASRLGVVNR